MQLQSNKDTAWEDQPPTVRGGGENASSSSSSSFSAMPSFAYFETFETQIGCQDRLGTSSSRKRAWLRKGGGRSLRHQVEHRLMGALGAKNDLLSYFYTENDLLPRQARGKHRETLKKDAFWAGAWGGIVQVIIRKQCLFPLFLSTHKSDPFYPDRLGIKPT
jgi:hypothetical protein